MLNVVFVRLAGGAVVEMAAFMNLQGTGGAAQPSFGRRLELPVVEEALLVPCCFLVSLA